MTDTKRGWARAIPYGTSEETSIVIDSCNYDDFQDWDFETCTPILTWPEDAKMSCMQLTGVRHCDDVVPNHLGLFIVSELFRDCLSLVRADGVVQTLPVRVDYRGADLGQFYVLNPLSAVAALDRSASAYSKFSVLDAAVHLTGQIKTISRAALDDAKLAGAPQLFRLAENLRWLIVGPELRNHIERAGLTGIWFKEVEVN